MSEDSDYIANLTRTTASNYNVQPAKGPYDKPAKPIDPKDHPADSGHNDSFNPGRADQ